MCASLNLARKLISWVSQLKVQQIWHQTVFLLYWNICQTSYKRDKKSWNMSLINFIIPLFISYNITKYINIFRFHHLYKCNELRIAICLIPDFKLRWIQNEKTKLTDLLKSIVQEFNHENYVVYSSTSKKQVLNKTDKTDEFFVFNKTLDQNQNDKSTIEYITQTYLSTDMFATEKNFPKALKCFFIKCNMSILWLTLNGCSVQEDSFSIICEEKCPTKISKWLYYLNLIIILIIYEQNV